MVDPGVQKVREWLRRQPFSLRILTLLLFMVEAVEEEFGEETKKTFEDDLREGVSKTTIAGRKSIEQSAKEPRQENTQDEPPALLGCQSAV